MMLLAFAAQAKGATGVREHLQEHRQQAPDVLQELGAPILLDDGDVHSDADFGIRMEQLPLRVQREIWSALASGASPSEETAVALARAFVRVAGRPRRRASDAVCLALARMLLSGEAGEEAQNSSTDAAFRRRMRRLTLSRVKFPSLEDEDDAAFNGLQNAPSREVDAASSSLSKRERAEASQDGRALEIEKKTNQRSRADTPPAEERPPLPKEMEDRASALAKQLAQLSRADASAAVDDVATRTFAMLAEVVNDVHTTYAANERSFQYLCHLLRMESTSDEALFQITSALVESNWSSRYAAIFLETSVLLKIQAADSVISRVLLQTALRFGSSYVSTLVDSLLLPLLVSSKSARMNRSVGPAQAEAITRILRSPDTVPTNQLDGFIQTSLTAATTNDSSDLSPHLLSNESALLVFQNILNTKPVLSPLTVERFVGACESVLERPEAEQVRGSLKFATVVFTLISKYPQQCAVHVETLEAIATQLTSIMAKTTLRSLQKLKTNK